MKAVFRFPRQRPSLAVLVGFCLALAPALAPAQQDYPSQPISIVLPYTPTAGGAIVLARQLSEDRKSTRLNSSH